MATAPTTMPSWLVDGARWIDTTLLQGPFWAGLLIGGVLVACFLLIIMSRRSGGTSLSLALPFNLGSVSYANTAHDRVLAWRMYVQLKTRKAALPFDDECDVIAEVYDSLRELFLVSRELLAEMPLSDLRRPQGVAELILRVLNDGIRPHLTRWQAGYRAWWALQMAEPTNKGNSPQTIQRGYPHYVPLIEDLRRTNTELSKFAEELLLIARANRSALKHPRTLSRIQPEMPVTAVAVRTLANALDSSVTVELPTVPYDSSIDSQCNTETEGYGASMQRGLEPITDRALPVAQRTRRSATETLP